MTYFSWILIGIAIGILLGTFLFLQGCDVVKPGINLAGLTEPIWADVQYVSDYDGSPFEGGWCAYVAAVIFACWHTRQIPTSDMVYHEQVFQDTYCRPWHETFIKKWHLAAVRHTWTLEQLAEYMQETGGPALCLIDGWERMLHAVVVIGIDDIHVWYHDPMLGPGRYTTHDHFRKSWKVGKNQCWTIRK